MEVRRKALGRGLGALIQTNGAADLPPEGEPLRVPVAEIAPNPFQPRRDFEDAALDELAQSIRQKGLLQPLIARRAGAGYELIAGERRWRAAQRAGFATVPILVRAADDRDMMELALVENLQRRDLNPLEEAQAYQRLMEEFHLTQEETAKRVGKDRSTIANAVRLLRLPVEIREQIARGSLSAGHARGLLGLDSPAEQVELAREVAARKLSVRETERRARARRDRQGGPDHAAAEARLTRAFATRVRIRMKKGGQGRIEIDYYSLEELNGLIERLAGPDQAPAAAAF